MRHLLESFLRRVLERLLLVYFVLYFLPQPFSALYEQGWRRVLPWVGAHALHLASPIVVFPNGSGDTTFNYVQALCLLVLALVATFTWTLCRPNSPVSPRTREAVRIYVRYCLGAILIEYGSLKFFHLQFPAVNSLQLIEPYGASTPMGLLWTFMGASTSYCVFAGVLEFGSGLLLLWRRTTLLGAVAAAAVLANIVMLNFSYDVPVKLFSLHLLAAALFVIAPDARRLLDVFVLQAPTSPRTLPFVLPDTWLRRTATGLFLVAVLAWEGWSVAQWQRSRTAASSPIAYEVEGWTGPVTERWERAAFGFGAVRAVGPRGGVTLYAADRDETKHSLVLRELPSPSESKRGQVVAELTSAQPDAAHLVLQGSFRGEPTEIHLTRIDETSFVLPNRGFHWINEYPFNR